MHLSASPIDKPPGGLRATYLGDNDSVLERMGFVADDSCAQSNHDRCTRMGSVSNLESINGNVHYWVSFCTVNIRNKLLYYSAIHLITYTFSLSHFSYPPPTMVLTEIEEERGKEMRLEALEKQQIIQYENYLAAATSRGPITEQTSHLLPQLMFMDPMGVARRPPQNTLDTIQSLNTTHRLGHLLCRSRKPDFLLDIIQRQQPIGSSQNMAWLADLVQSCEGTLSQLPVQCLCEYLLSASAGQADKQSRLQQLLAHLHLLLTDPLQDSQHAYEVLEYFLRRLSSQSSFSRFQAITGLKLVINTIPMEEPMEVEGENDQHQ